MFSLETVLFIVKRFYNFFYIIFHVVFYVKDNNFKSLLSHVRNNMETTLHVKDYKFSKPGKWWNKKIDFKIDSYET